MPGQHHFRSITNRILAVAMIVIGIVMIVRTLAAGGGALASGMILGILFLAAGGGRLYVEIRGRRAS